MDAKKRESASVLRRGGSNVIAQPNKPDHAGQQRQDKIGEFDGDLNPRALFIAALPFAKVTMVQLAILFRFVCRR